MEKIVRVDRGNSQRELMPIDIRTKQATVYHATTYQRISDDLAEKASNQKPFEGLTKPGNDEEAEQYYDQAYWGGLVERFLQVQFSALGRWGVSVSIAVPVNEVTLKDEEEKIKAAKQAFNSQGLTGQSAAIENMYREFKAIRTSFAYLREQEAIQPHCILPMKYFADIFMAAPVMYIKTKTPVPPVGRNTNRPLSVDDTAIKSLCANMGNQRFTNAYLMLNYFRRDFSEFQGDLMPPETSKLVSLLSNEMDLLMIATPYLDTVSKEYESLQWPRLVDPFLIGFNWSTPGLLYFWSRWSNTGLFPAVDHMIANTIQFMRSNAMQFGKLQGISNIWGVKWFRGTESVGIESDNLGRYKNEIIRLYEENKLLSTFRNSLNA